MQWYPNVVLGPTGFGAAVLVRALGPLFGENLMAKNRSTTRPACKPQDLCRGPERLWQALSITGAHHGWAMQDEPLCLATPKGFRRPLDLATPRVGISKALEAPWRFCIPPNKYVSGPAKLNRSCSQKLILEIFVTTNPPEARTSPDYSIVFR